MVRLEDVGGAKFTVPPLLVVEVRSPSTALIDLNRKKAAYQKFGVPSYWIVDPEPARPELTVFELRDSGYVLEATSTQPLTVSDPFTVIITPAEPDQGPAPLAGIQGPPQPFPLGVAFGRESRRG